MRPKPLLAALLLTGLATTALGAELYGRPLRGLTPVPIPELTRKAAEYDGKTVRVRGELRSEKGAFRIVEGPAALRVTMRDPEATLPGDANGAAATAEGLFRAKGAAGEPALAATGLELTR